MRTIGLLAMAIAIGAAGLAQAAPCRDGKGKFVTCPPPAAAKKCRDAGGKFVKCSTVAVPK